jgi:DNA-binding NtrC family response regulator
MPARRPIVLIVDDDADYLTMLREALGRDFDIVTAQNADDASRKLTYAIDVMLLDLRLQGGGEEDRGSVLLLDAVKGVRPIPVIIMTAFADIDTAVELMKMGATDFVQKSRLDIAHLKKMLLDAVRRAQSDRREAAANEEVRRLRKWELVGDSRQINELRQLIDAVAENGRSNVLIRGETGTGKGVVAHAIHTRGVRKDGPFVNVTLPNLTPTLIESQLFGNARGAFTDAREAKVGHIATAASGVLFFDEIGDLARELQPKLLHFLDSRSFIPVGSTAEISVDVQVVCATNLDLEEAVRSGQFREDLYYRLRTIEIFLPPLRERLEDVPLLVDHILYQLRQKGARIAGITTTALERLCRYAYPGNVRQLTSIVDSANVMAGLHKHPMIDCDDLPSYLTTAKSLVRMPRDGEQIDLDGELARVEVAFLERALQMTAGRKSDAWRLLGLNDRFALRRRVKRIQDTYPELMKESPILRNYYVDPAERIAQ